MKIRPINADEHFPIEPNYEMDLMSAKAQQEFESAVKWLYVGADIREKNYAKIGITTGDLQSRSYSSARPTYYLFCGFKALHETSREKLERIEKSVLFKLDTDYRFGSYRVRHTESGELSECYYGAPLTRIFKAVHQILYDHHSNDFNTCIHYNISGYPSGCAIKCEFNDKVLINSSYYQEIILQRE